jgi:hypothetical protein
LSLHSRDPYASRSTADTYPDVTRQAERGNPVSPPAGGQFAARQTYGGAGLGCWKKRMPGCNGSDTGCNITRHESEPTSNWSYIARESVEPCSWGKANDDDGPAAVRCVLTGFNLGRHRLATHHRRRATAADAYCEGNSGGSLGQGESLAMAPHPFVLRQVIGGPTRGIQSRPQHGGG